MKYTLYRKFYKTNNFINQRTKWVMQQVQLKLNEGHSGRDDFPKKDENAVKTQPID